MPAAHVKPVYLLTPAQEEGMLLGFHVKKDARQLLQRVASRARLQAFGVLNSLLVKPIKPFEKATNVFTGPTLLRFPRIHVVIC